MLHSMTGAPGVRRGRRESKLSFVRTRPCVRCRTVLDGSLYGSSLLSTKKRNGKAKTQQWKKESKHTGRRTHTGHYFMRHASIRAPQISRPPRKTPQRRHSLIVVDESEHRARIVDEPHVEGLVLVDAVVEVLCACAVQPSERGPSA